MSAVSVLAYFGDDPTRVYQLAQWLPVLELLDGKDTVSVIAKIRAVPKCAMQVQRSADAGDFSAYAPQKPCGCFFEQEASGVAPASCTTCSDDSTCGSAGQCVFGFCEKK